MSELDLSVHAGAAVDRPLPQAENVAVRWKPERAGSGKR
jgi:hypothetical protein